MYYIFIYTSSEYCVDNQVVRGEKNANVESVNPVGSSPATEKTNAFQSPPRKALSPINTNINIENVSEKKKRHVFLSDPENSVDNTFQVLGTPLEKFNTRSFNLKVYNKAYYHELDIVAPFWF